MCMRISIYALSYQMKMMWANSIKSIRIIESDFNVYD